MPGTGSEQDGRAQQEAGPCGPLPGLIWHTHGAGLVHCGASPYRVVCLREGEPTCNPVSQRNLLSTQVSLPDQGPGAEPSCQTTQGSRVPCPWWPLVAWLLSAADLHGPLTQPSELDVWGSRTLLDSASPNRALRADLGLDGTQCVPSAARLPRASPGVHLSLRLPSVNSEDSRRRGSRGEDSPRAKAARFRHGPQESASRPTLGCANGPDLTTDEMKCHTGPVHAQPVTCPEKTIPQASSPGQSWPRLEGHTLASS